MSVRPLTAAPTVGPPSAAPPAAPARRRVWALRGAATVAVVVAALLPATVDAYTIALASTALVLAVLAMSTQLLVGVAGLPSFGQSAYLGIGAYTAVLLANDGVTSGPVQFVAAAATGAVAAAVTAPLVLRTRGTAFLMVTFAVQSLVVTIGSQWKSVTGGDEGLAMPAVIGWPGGAPLTAPAYVYWYVLACVLVLSVLLALLLRSRLALVLRGSAGHEPRMKSLGHRVTGELTLGYIAAGALAGAGGALMAAVNRAISPADFGFELASVALLAAAMGAGTMIGAVFGAVTIVVVRDLIGGSTDGHAPALLGVLFLAVVYGRPLFRALAARVRPIFARKPS